jgi:hypothetical protein
MSCETLPQKDAMPTALNQTGGAFREEALSTAVMNTVRAAESSPARVARV